MTAAGNDMPAVAEAYRKHQAAKVAADVVVALDPTTCWEQGAPDK